MPSSKNGGQINFGVGFETDQTSLNKLKKSLQDLQKIRLGDFKGSAKDLDQMKQTAQKVQIALEKAFNPTLNTTNISTFQSELQKTVGSVDQVYNKLKLAGPQGQVAFHQMATEILTTNLKLKQTNSLIDSMGKTMVNTVKWGIASSVMNTFTQSVQGAFQYVQSLEKSLTNIRIVTGDSTEKMAQFAEQANRSAQALGRSTLDYSKASLTFYQQGLKDEDVQARTEATLKAQNITGAGSQMADYLTSVWNGYKVANEEAELYVDKLAAVADSSASDMSQLAIAMSKVASTASTMGVDIDQLNAQIATVVATTRQAPESVGTAFKTIYTRMNDIKTGADDAEVSLGKYSGTMASLGFNVLDATGHLRDTGQVMEEIGGRWETLTREQQIYLAQTMGGQRQVNQLMALFDNWTTYSELLNTSLESEGTLAEKNSRYMESLGAKMEQLGAAGERVKDALINENELKGGVQALTNLVNLMGNFIESIGGGSTALLAFGSLATQVFQDTIARQINNVITNLQDKKNNELIKQQDKKQTELFGKSQGYDQGVITKLVDNKAAIQDYYNIMSQGEVNAYNNIIKTVAAQEQQTVALQKSKDAGENFKTYLEQVPGIAKKIQEDLGETAETLKMKAEEAGQVITQNWSFNKIRQNSTDFVQSMTKAFDDLGKSFGGMQAFENMESFQGFKKAYDDIMYLKEGVQPTQEQLENLFTTWRSFTKELTISTGNVAVLDETNSKLELSKAKLQAATNEAENFRNKIQQLALVRSFVGLVGGLGQISSGIKGAINLTKIWQNENLSTGQKILQTFTNLSMTVGMLTSGFSKMIDSYNQIKKATGGLQAAVESFATAKKIAAAEAAGADNLQLLSQEELQAAYEVTGIKAWASLGPYIAIAAAVAAAVGLIVVAYKAWNKEADAAKKANEVAVDVKKTYDDLKTSMEEVKSALEDLHAAEDNLEDLTKGTQEWRDALQQCNDKVLELISNYPELAQYVTNQNGQLKLSAEGEQAYLDKMQEGVQNARNASYIASSNSREADAIAAAANIGHNSIYEDQTTKTNTGAEGNVFKMANADQVKSVVEAIDKVIGEGVEIKGNLSELSDEIAKQTGYSQQLVSSILANEDAVLQLKAQLEQNETTDKLMYETMAQGALTNNTTFKGMDQLGQQVASAIGGADLKEATEKAYNQWIDRMSGARMDRFDSASDVSDILEALNKAQGTNWRMDSNAVRGGEANRTLAFVEQDGNTLHEFTRQQIASTIATKEALEKLGASAENTSNILSAINKSNESEGAKTGVQQFLAGNDINLKESELESLSGGTLQNIFGENITQVAKDAGYESAEAFKQAFEENVNYAKEEFASIGENAFGPVKQQLEKSLSDGDYLLNTQKNLEDIFTNTFRQSGTEAMTAFQGLKDSLMQSTKMTEQQKEAILSLFANADLSTPKGLNDLEESLRQIGAQTILANENWIKFKGEIQDSQFVNPIDTIFDQQASIDNITGNLKKGDIISEEDLQTLAALDSGVRDLFKRTAQGYELIGNKGSLLKLLAGSNPDYLEAANNLDSLKQKAEEISSIISKDINVEKLNGGDLQGYSSAIMNKINGDEETYAALGVNEDFIEATKQRLDELMSTPISERNEEWDQEYEKVTANLTEFITKAQTLPEIINQSTESLRSAAALNAQTLSELVSMFQNNEISGQQFGAALQTVSKREMEDLGFDPEVYENYVDLLQATNEEYAENEYLARQVANANMRISQGTQDLIDNWKDWNEVFQDYLASDRDVGVLAEKWGQLKDTLANLFDMDAESFDLLGPDFVADNLDKIEAVKDGIPGAYEDLEGIIEEELWGRLENAIDNNGKELNIELGQVSIDDSAIYTSSQQLFNQLQAISDDATIEVGTNVDDANLIAGLNNMIDASNLASDEMAAIFDAMGYDVEFKEKPGQIHEHSENTQYYSPPEYEIKEIGSASLGFAGLSLPVTVPVLKKGGEYISADSGKKQDYEPGTYAINTITKNGKGNGGKISRKTAGAPSNKSGGGGGGKGRKGGGGKGGKGSQPKQPNKAKGVTNKADRYRDNTVKANKLANQLSKLNKQQERLSGKDSLKNLQKQLDILKKQNDTITERIRLQKDEQTELKNSLSKYGATFDKDGTLNNYKTVFDAIIKQYNDAVAKWNKMSAEQQQKNKDFLNNAKETMDKAKKELQQYDKNQMDILKSEQDRLDNLQAQIDNQVKQFDLKIEAELDLTEARRNWNEFKRTVIDQIRDDDILGLNEVRFRDLSTYFDDANTGSIQNLTRDLQTLLGSDGGNIFSASTFVNELGMLSVEDRKAKLDEIEKISDKLREELINYKQEINEIKESIYDMLDAIQDAFDDQKDTYEFIGDALNHGLSIVQLMYGDEAYDKMDNYYKQIDKNNRGQLELLKGQTDFWRTQMDDARKNMENIAKKQGTDSNQYKEARKLFKEYEKLFKKSSSDLNSMIEDSLKNIIDKYTNAVDEIFKKFELNLGNGKTFEEIEDEWDMMNKQADAFFDKINAAYEIEKIQNSFENAIRDNEGNIAAQQSLNNLMEQQLAYLKDKEKLSQYDVDRANALLQVEIKRLALENARSNKSKLRLRRDSQGNYSYQYTADTESINNAQQELADAQNSLYNVNKSAYVDNLSSIEKLTKEMEEKIAEINRDAILSDEEKLQKRLALEKYYGGLINDLVAENANIRNNLMDSGLEELARINGVEADAYKALTEEQKIDLLTPLIPQLDSATSAMVAEIQKAGGDINILFSKLLAPLDEVNKQRKKDIEDIQDITKQDLEEVAEGYNELATQGQALLQNNQKLLQNQNQQIKNVQKAIQKVQTLTEKYKETTKAAIEAAQAAQKILNWDRKQTAGLTNGGSEVTTTGGSNNTNKTNGKTNKTNNKTSGNSTNKTGNKNITGILQDNFTIANFEKQGQKAGTKTSTSKKTTVDKIKVNINQIENTVRERMAEIEKLNKIDDKTKAAYDKTFKNIQSNINNVTDQAVYIKADFPNVTSEINDIINAFNSLVGLAAQKTSSKNRTKTGSAGGKGGSSTLNSNKKK